MSKSQREKGRRFEVEIQRDLEERVGVECVQRRYGQAAESGCDITLGKFRIECKRRKGIAVYDWIEQACASCDTEEIPVVVCRGDGKEALVVLRYDDFVPLMANEL